MVAYKSIERLKMLKALEQNVLKHLDDKILKRQTIFDIQYKLHATGAILIAHQNGGHKIV